MYVYININYTCVYIINIYSTYIYYTYVNNMHIYIYIGIRTDYDDSMFVYNSER